MDSSDSKPIKEHELFDQYKGERPIAKYDSLFYDGRTHKKRAHPLIEWTYSPFGNGKPGYYSSFNIGAQWAVDKDKNEREAVVVTPKMENVDFVRMFMVCFGSGIEVDRFNEIYEISVDETPIKTSAFNSVLSPLIVIHFLSVVGRIKSLKKGYVHRSENLKKVKGHINILKNERKNIMMKRFDRVFCEYDEYSVDIPENRLIKKALLFAKQMVFNIGGKSLDMGKLRVLMARDLAMFEQVSSEVEIREVKQLRGHKIYAEYKEAIRLAKLILRRYDYNISKINENKSEVVPFVIDMSLLYEHYVLGLLREAYGEQIRYQIGDKQDGFPDFLFKAHDYKDSAILDTKYKPRYENNCLASSDIRQLSGYGRNVNILNELGYKDNGDEVTENSEIPPVPCVIIYPEENKRDETVNPFIRNGRKVSLSELWKKKPEKYWVKFYKICVPLPVKK